MRILKVVLKLLPFLLIGAYAGAVALAYKNPPLTACGSETSGTVGRPIAGIDLCNEGWWSVQLTDAYILQDRQTQVAPYATSPTEAEVVAAASIAIAPHQHPHRTGALPGWTIPRTRPGADSHALRIESMREPTRDETLVVQYTYLGWWPMTLRTTVDWPGVQ